MDLLSVAQKFFVGKAWNSETVLRMGVELLSVANLLPNLSFQDKTSLVCQTILRMLDGVEKVGKEHSLESIAIMPTTAQLEQCKNLVKTLPLILELVNTGLSRPVCVPRLQSCLPLGSFSWGCMRNQVVETVTAVEDLVKHPQHYLEEMRGLVSKVEKLLSSAESVTVPVAEPVAVAVAVAVAEAEPVPVAVPEAEPVPVAVPEAEAVTVAVAEAVTVAEHVTVVDEHVTLPESVSLPSAEPTHEPVPSAFSAVAESLLEPRSVRLPPSPVLSDEQLPGGLATPEEVVLSQ